MTEFFAQPYSLDHSGFYFDNLRAFEAGMERLKQQACEEVEIQFIEGDDHQAALAKAAEIHQSNVALWFETLENLDETATEQLCFLLDLGYSLEDALERYDEVALYEGRPADYAQELFEDCYDIPDFLQNYIDYDAIARDMGYNGEITEIRPGLLVTNVHEF